MSSQVSWQDLRRAAQAKGCTAEADSDAQCYRVEAPAGHNFDGDIHELVQPWAAVFMYRADSSWKAAARLEMLSRLQQVEVTRCTLADCDWCRSRETCD